MVYTSESYIAIPPGATIDEMLKIRGITNEQFADWMGITEEDVSLLIDGVMHITPEIADKLNVVMGPPASFWNGLESIYREKLALIEAENGGR